MTKISKKVRCHTTQLIPIHRNGRAHITWLSRPRLGIITPKYEPECECGCIDTQYSRRIRRIRSASERLRVLAQPCERKITQKYTEPEPEKLKCACKPPTTESVSTRLDELAIPYVRRLVGTKDEFKGKPTLEPDRIGVLNQHIQRSLHTVYTRLANFKMPPKREEKKKFTANDWKRFNEWMATRGLPKRSFSEPKLIRKKRPIDFERMDTLSQPKRPVVPYTNPGIKISDPVQPISRKALTFEMTPRYQQITLPFKPPPGSEIFEMYENPYSLSRDLAKITATPREKFVAPKSVAKKYAKGDTASVIFEVSKNALKAKPSEGVKKLAKPREVNAEQPRDNPFGVSKKALNPLKKDKLEYYTKLSEPQKRGA